MRVFSIGLNRLGLQIHQAAKGGEEEGIPAGKAQRSEVRDQRRRAKYVVSDA